MNKKVRHQKSLSARNWNMLNKVLCGMEKARCQDKEVWFLTLTTSPVTVEGLDDKQKLELIQKNFRSLLDRYRYEFGEYQDGRCIEKADFGNYFSVRTNEGYGVIHLLYEENNLNEFTKLNNENWIVNNWNELHGSHIVFNKKCGDDKFKASHYVISHYVAGQKGLLQFGYTRNWIYGGFSKDYLEIRKESRDYNTVEKYKLSNGGYIEYNPVDPYLFRSLLIQNIRRKFNVQVLTEEDKLKILCRNMGVSYSEGIRYMQNGS